MTSTDLEALAERVESLTVALPLTMLTRQQRRYCMKRGLLPPRWEVVAKEQTP